MADRCVSVGGWVLVPELVKERAGAEELKLGCWKMAEERLLPLFALSDEEPEELLRLADVDMLAMLTLVDVALALFEIVDEDGVSGSSFVRLLPNVLDSGEELESNDSGGSRGTSCAS